MLRSITLIKSKQTAQEPQQVLKHLLNIKMFFIILEILQVSNDCY